ncbi:MULTISPECIES: AraC family transcriptional regulator [Pseudoxanthomonas]|uniref:AraC family transcriptional regulator n=1 Tax=Pseudoxanthomonas winnipegensis TaxID=2480810 RepID=A0AAW8GEH1_9GAMM|nr:MULTISPECIES: AraC family transcriptional regulator [Pseudoxanthomonas]MDQ1120222.1 AraC family transcriptional regulator [Pseudoxanthomonas winnipegensis]MDQ1133433.1 AraC family transcriptional regulator [Pseudoxanthomonas winnipegensis]MDR6140321.1 AraC family transcriptional regulator [Pseudoxanthomonas sp. SORGH_AS_0997]
MPPSSWFSQMRLMRYAANGAMQAHHHDRPSLCLVVDGGYQERIRGRADWHRPGEMMFCPADEPHAQTFADTGAVKILLDPRAGTLDYLRGHLPLTEAPFTGSVQLAAIARRLRAELCADPADSAARLAAEGLAMEALAEFARHAAAPVRVEPWLQRAREYVHAHACSGFALEDMAQALQHHPVHVARSFRAAFGRSVGDMVRQLRVAEAARLLRETSRPLATIAADCGFADQAHFSRSFRAAYGVPPSRFRRERR